MSTVEQINSQVQTLRTRLQSETDFNNQLKQKLSTIFRALGDINKSLEKVADQNNELSVFKTKLDAANKRIQAAELSDAESQKAVAQLGEVVNQLNQIDLNANVAPDGIIANAQKTISQIQGQLAKLTNASATAPAPANQFPMPKEQPGFMGGRKRRRRRTRKRGGYSYRKKSPSVRKSRRNKNKKSKTRSRTRSRTRSKTH